MTAHAARDYLVHLSVEQQEQLRRAWFVSAPRDMTLAEFTHKFISVALEIALDASDEELAARMAGFWPRD